MSLGYVDEIPSVRRQRDGVIESWIGEAHISGSVQSHPVELHLHVVVAIPGRVVQNTGLLVHLEDVGDFEVMIGDGVQQFPPQVVQEDIPETRTL